MTSPLVRKKKIVANENVVDACEDAKLNFFPHPDTMFITSNIELSWHGLSLSKYGFIRELVIKSAIITVTEHITIFIITFFLSNFHSKKIR